MKKKGDLKQERPPSFRQIAGEFAKGLVNPDPRFSRFWTFQPTEATKNFFANKKKIKVLIGGNRSGKTIQSIVEDIIVYTGMIPPSLQGIYPHKLPMDRARHVRIILHNFTKHWPETIKPLLVGDTGMLPEAWSSNYDPDQHIFYGPDGSTLSIHAIDPADDIDPRILRGANVDHTHIDEINREAVHNESVTRAATLHDGPQTVTHSFCPQEGIECWTYERLYLTNYDRLTDEPLSPERVHPDIFVLRISMYDNPYIGEAERQRIISVLRDWEIPFRVYGRYSSQADNPFFDMETMIRWDKEKKCYEGLWVKCIEDQVDEEQGIFKGHMEITKESHSDDLPLWQIWDMPKEELFKDGKKVQDAHKYVMSADTSEGNKESDYQCADIWDVTHPDKTVQVAQLRIRKMKVGMFAVQCCCMANAWGNCLLVPEALGSGLVFVDRARNYGNLYKRMTVGKMDEIETERLGWSTNHQTKPMIMEDLYKTLKKMANSGHCPVKSRQTLMELFAFEERIERNKITNAAKIIWGARRGMHDDTVMSMAIGFRIAQHEHDKVSTCRLGKLVKQLPEKSYLEKVAQQASSKDKVFSGMVKKPDLASLRSKLHRGKHERRGPFGIQRSR